MAALQKRSRLFAAPMQGSGAFAGLQSVFLNFGNGRTEGMLERCGAHAGLRGYCRTIMNIFNFGNAQTVGGCGSHHLMQRCGAIVGLH